MISLKPHQILHLLGFQIPEEGITHPAEDSYLIAFLLRIAGQSIDITKTPDIQIESLIRFLSLQKEGSLPKSSGSSETKESLTLCTQFLQSLLKDQLKYNPS